MNVKALMDCVGLGYKLKKGESAELNGKLAEKLIKFGYVEEMDVDDNSGIENSDSTLSVEDLPNKSGWYELPNGEKIQGKEKAEEALKELLKEGDD